MAFGKKIMSYFTKTPEEQLISAAERGDRNRVAELLLKGVNANHQDKHGWTVLMEAARQGHLDVCRELIAKGADVNAKTKWGFTVLMGAAQKGHLDVCRELITKGADVNAKTDHGHTALMWAAQKGRLSVCRELIAKGANVNAETNFGFTVLMEAAEYGHLDVCQELIAKGADVNAKTESGWTALMKATKNGHLKLCQELIAKGADVDVKNNVGETALKFANREASEKNRTTVVDILPKQTDGVTTLLWAAQKGHFDVCRELIAKGADVNAKNENHWTALRSAAEEGHLDVCRELIGKGADVNAKNNNGWTALMSAALESHLDVCRELIAKGADVNAKNNNGWTALMSAAQEGHLDVCRELITKGADVKAKENDGWTALMLAAPEGHLDVCRELVAKGADVNAKNNNGWTVLMNAAQEGHLDVCRELIANGADVKAKENNDWTALMLAAQEGHLDVCQELIAKEADVKARNNDGDTAFEIVERGDNAEKRSALLDILQQHMMSEPLSSGLSHSAPQASLPTASLGRSYSAPQALFTTASPALSHSAPQASLPTASPGLSHPGPQGSFPTQHNIAMAAAVSQHAYTCARGRSPKEQQAPDEMLARAELLLEFDEGGAQFIVMKDGATYYVAFPGSYRLQEDVLDTNAHYLKVPIHSCGVPLPPIGCVHKGFAKRARQVLSAQVGANSQALREWLACVLNSPTEPHAHLVVTGHSLGGATATLVTLTTLLHESCTTAEDVLSRVSCITFGAPLVLDEEAVGQVQKNVASRFFHVVNQCDIVPRLLVCKTEEQMVSVMPIIRDVVDKLPGKGWAFGVVKGIKRIREKWKEIDDTIGVSRLQNKMRAAFELKVLFGGDSGYMPIGSYYMLTDMDAALYHDEGKIVRKLLVTLIYKALASNEQCNSVMKTFSQHTLDHYRKWLSQIDTGEPAQKAMQAAAAFATTAFELELACAMGRMEGGIQDLRAENREVAQLLKEGYKILRDLSERMQQGVQSGNESEQAALKTRVEDVVNMRLEDIPTVYGPTNPITAPPDPQMIQWTDLTVNYKLGVGGQGTVWGATHAELGKVAIKVYPEIGAKFESRYKRELSIVQRLYHDNIIHVFGGVVTDEGTYSIVMEYCDQDLEDLILNPPGDTAHGTQVDWALQIACGMAYCHNQGIIHGDLKPANILITNDSKIKICDWGSSKINGYITVTELPKRTLKYLPKDERRSVESDVYAFGVTLYELMAMMPAEYDGPGYLRMDELDGALEDEVPKVAELIRKCTHKDCQQRPTFNEIRNELREVEAALNP